MKILTLNTHSIIEENYEEKCRIFARATAEIQPDIILFQEVNQTVSKEAKSINFAGKIPVKEDNHALKICSMLKEKGINYNFVWMGIKCGYGKYDEGLAILSTAPLKDTREILLSPNDDYSDWKTRKALLCSTHGLWVCTTHMGWWDDRDDPFQLQFEKLNSALEDYDDVILGGDFNIPDTSPGYELVVSNGWYDTRKGAKSKSGYATMEGSIAGWEENKSGIRIDYIFSKQNKNIKNSATVFDGVRYNVISDHFGVISEF